jgi:hypothetical protein
VQDHDRQERDLEVREGAPGERDAQDGDPDQPRERRSDEGPEQLRVTAPRAPAERVVAGTQADEREREPGEQALAPPRPAIDPGPRDRRDETDEREQRREVARVDQSAPSSSSAAAAVIPR